jgi:hypothetical protein
MKLVACDCGTLLDLERVPRTPFQSCPSCKAALSEDAVDFMHLEVRDDVNPTKAREPLRAAEVQAVRRRTRELTISGGDTSRIASLEAEVANLRARVPEIDHPV